MSEAIRNSAADVAAPASWLELLSGGNLVRSLALSGGIALHAINVYISTTILPSAVSEIGGLEFYAWNTTLFVIASIVGASLSAPFLARTGPRAAYIAAATCLACGAMICALAPSMNVMLLGRLVQGIGGGLLLALPYAIIRRVFAEHLWARAMALFSSMWGVATLLGPLVGGVFAELSMWRGAFWALVPAAFLLSAAAALVLPTALERREASVRVPITQLVLLAAAVLTASWSSLGLGAIATVTSAIITLLLILVLIVREGRVSKRLLPSGTFSIGSRLGALYAASGLLAVTVTCVEIFLPLFLQELQGYSPLGAGLLAAVMSAGWTIAAIFSSGLGPKGQGHALAAGPALSVAAVLVLAPIVAAPTSGAGALSLLLLVAVLILAGAGVGLAYPHLAARVLKNSPPGEEDTAASGIMTVQLCATAFGGAIAGLTVNVAAGGTGGEVDFSNAAFWLFLVVTIAPALSFFISTRMKGGVARG